MPFVSSTLKSFEKWRSPLFGATGNFYEYQQFFQHRSINSFFNTVSVSRYSRSFTVTRDPD
jgi:hypothetical protein